MTTVVSWNINKREASWRELCTMDADIALLQEAAPPPADLTGKVEYGSADWSAIDYPALPLVVKLSDRVSVDWLEPVLVQHVANSKRKNIHRGQIAVSDPTTIAAARVHPRPGEPFLVVSMYARWLPFHPLTEGKSSIHSDASMHRIISDLSVLIRDPNPSRHRILAAGDMNAFYGVAHHRGLGEPYREAIAWERLDRLGLQFLGPQHPHGRKSERVDPSIAAGTNNTPTYYTNRQRPETAKNQLDYVFASRGFHQHIRTRALNDVDEWGPSDHCRILIEID